MQYEGQKWLAEVLEEVRITYSFQWLFCIPRELASIMRHSRCFGSTKTPDIVINEYLDSTGELHSTRLPHVTLPMEKDATQPAESADMANGSPTPSQAQLSTLTRPGRRRMSVLGRTDSDTSVQLHDSVRLPKEREKLSKLQKRDLSPHKQGVRVLKFSPDGMILARYVYLLLVEPIFSLV